jgi:ankyrin repeat protein
MAVEIQDYDIAAKLLEFKADLNFKENSHGDTPLHISMKTCKSTREMMLTCLLLERAKENGIINIRNSRGETALHIAVSRSKGQGTYLVDLVLRFSPDLSIQNIDGKTALDLAHTVGNPQVLQKLQDIVKRLPDKDEEEEPSLGEEYITSIP